MHDSTTLPSLQSVRSPSSLHTSTTRWTTAYQTGWHICIACPRLHTLKKKHFSFNPPVNGEWIVHVGGCLTWCVTSLTSDMISLSACSGSPPQCSIFSSFMNHAIRVGAKHCVARGSLCKTNNAKCWIKYCAFKDCLDCSRLRLIESRFNYKLFTLTSFISFTRDQRPTCSPFFCH